MKGRHSVGNEMRAAKKLWPEIDRFQQQALRRILVEYRLGVSLGEVIRVEGRWYVTHTGLLLLATRRGCRGIESAPQLDVCDSAANRWVFRAVVYKTRKSKGFVGYGDADPSNVSFKVRGAEMRIAETRAVNRALRKAYGIGLCSAEELGSHSETAAQGASGKTYPYVNGNGAGQPRLRDQLCLLIRQFQLDPALVKRYAASYCGADSISAASRESVESFVSHLKKSAEEDLGALDCKLNSFAPVAVEP